MKSSLARAKATEFDTVLTAVGNRLKTAVLHRRVVWRASTFACTVEGETKIGFLLLRTKASVGLYKAFQLL